MNLLCIGDPHLKISRLETSKEFLSWVNSVAKDVKPDYIINLGDTFDTHAVLRSEILKIFLDHVDEAGQYSKHGYWYVLGNHDMYKPSDSKYHALQTLKNYEFSKTKFVVVDEPTHEGDMSFFPYTHDISKFPKESNKICVCHQTFLGADFGYVRPEEGVDPNSIQGAEIIVSGHIHMRQMFNKVVYPGSPYSQGANDINQSKGVMILDTDTLKYRFIECPLPKWRGLKYIVDDKVSIDQVHEELLTTLTPKDKWIVEVSGPKTELLAYRDSKKVSMLTEAGFDVNFRFKFTDKDKKKLEIKSVVMNDIVSEYIDKIYKGSLDKEELKKCAIDISSRIDVSDAKLKL